MQQSTEERVAKMLKQMRTAMPEIMRQVAVYERSIKITKQQTTPKASTKFKGA